MDTIKTTLKDFPNEIASIIFFRGCQLRCPFCYNEELVYSIEEYSMEEIMDFVDERSKYVSGIVLSGGEPLLQKNIIKIINYIKSKGLKVKLDTNGFSDKFKEVLSLVDYVAMDIKAPPNKYKEATGGALFGSMLLSNIEAIKISNIDYEFRTTVVPEIFPEEDLEKDFNKIGRLITGASLYCIQGFRSSKTLDKEFEGKNEYSIDVLNAIGNIVEPYVEKVVIK